MVENDMPEGSLGDAPPARIPWTPRRKRIVQCLGRAGGAADLEPLLECCVEATDEDGRSERIRRRTLAVDLPALEGYGVVRWEAHDRVALEAPYVGDDRPPAGAAVRRSLTAAGVLATAIGLHAVHVPPFVAVPPLWYATAAVATLVVLPVWQALLEDP